MSKKYRNNNGTSALVLSLITLFFASALAFGVVACASNGFTDWSFVPWVNGEETPPATDTTASAVRLSAGPTTRTAQGYVTRELTATVFPATATNKAVDWAATWEDEEKTESVSEYLTVTCEDGSTTATVTCLQAFDGNIVITVTTRQREHTDTCVVSFVGLPTEITLESEIAPETDGSYRFEPAKTFTFDIVGTNPFDSVSDTLEYEVSVQGFGSFKTGTYLNSTQSWESDFETVNYADVLNKFVSVTIDGNTVTVNSIKAVENYYDSFQNDGGIGTYYGKYYETVEDCYIEVTVTEKTSGVSETVKIVITNDIVSSVVLEDSIVF
ncbi:MAG: hypothetical protein IJY70_03140 [Clostridia bacterium]|nr:hypothetical protein [Clostridia bacterium]